MSQAPKCKTIPSVITQETQNDENPKHIKHVFYVVHGGVDPKEKSEVRLRRV